MNREAIIEKMARAIADMIYPSYDDAFKHKQDWIDGRGEKNGIPIDINAPFQCDYDDAAQAALSAIEAAGVALVPEQTLLEIRRLSAEREPNPDTAFRVIWDKVNAALNASPYRAYDERSENKAVKHAVKHSPKERKQNANGGISD